MTMPSMDALPGPAGDRTPPPHRHPRKRHAIGRDTFRHIEANLRDYDETKRRVGELELQIAERGMGIAYDNQAHEQQASPEWSDPTPKRASAIAQHKLIGRMRAFVTATDTVYELLPDEYRALVQAFYWGKKFVSKRQVAAQLGISEDTFGRRRTRIVEALAEQLGEW